MAQTSTPAMPTFTAPKFDGAAVLSLYDANVATFVAVQQIALDYIRTVAGRQVAFLTEAHAKFGTALKTGAEVKEPKAIADETKTVVEKVVADAKETVEAGVKAHGEIVSLLSDRAKANLEQVQKLAA